MKAGCSSLLGVKIDFSGNLISLAFNLFSQLGLKSFYHLRAQKSVKHLNKLHSKAM